MELKKVPGLTRLLVNDEKKHSVDVSTGYIEGDVLYIRKGPLRGYEGHISKIDRHKRIAYVDVSLFGKKITVKVSLEITSKDNKKSFEL